MGVLIMATTILFLIVILLTIAIFPWIGTMVGHTGVHHTDLKAGDEGED
jgi:hypothetical protein